MMKMSDIKPAPGSRKRSKRVGRGHGCHGKTACKGSKGQNARSGGSKGPGFEGGQTPWYRRLPKYKGFKSLDKEVFSIVNLASLGCFEANEVVTPEALMEKKLVKNIERPIKLLAKGILDKALTVRLHKFSGKAVEAIEAAGGKAEVI